MISNNKPGFAFMNTDKRVTAKGERGSSLFFSIPSTHSITLVERNGVTRHNQQKLLKIQKNLSLIKESTSLY